MLVVVVTLAPRRYQKSTKTASVGGGTSRDAIDIRTTLPLLAPSVSVTHSSPILATAVPVRSFREGEGLSAREGEKGE